MVAVFCVLVVDEFVVLVDGCVELVEVLPAPGAVPSCAWAVKPVTPLTE